MGNRSTLGPFRFEDPRQRRIHRRLHLVGEGPSAFFRDACRLMANHNELHATSHFVGHALREIESGLRDVLESLSDRNEAAAGSPNTHAAKIGQILGALGIPEHEPVAKAWLQLASEGLYRRAHRDALERPRPVDDDFRQFWDRAQFVLDAILERFEERYLEVHGKVDKLLEKPRPQRDDVAKLRNHLPNNLVTRAYFFENIQHPDWLSALADAGFFDHPPGPETEEEEGLVRFSMWPASRFLARVASAGWAPGEIVRIARGIPRTNNISVHHDLVAVGLALPPAMAAEIVDWLTGVLEGGYRPLLSTKYGELISHLARGGRSDGALKLSAAVLRVNPANPGQESGLTSRATPRIDPYHYEEILKQNIPDLTTCAPLETLRLLCNVLDSTLAATRRSGDLEKPEDWSPTWRPTIEGDGHSFRGDVSNPLVSAMRNAALQFLNSNPARVPEVVKLLEAHSWSVFRRLSLFVLSDFAASAPGLVRERLLNREFLDNWQQEPEYVRLAARGLGILDPESRNQLLQWIDEGPDLRERAVLIKQSGGRAAEDDELVSWKERWQRDRLAPIAQYLSEEKVRRFHELIRKHGEPRKAGSQSSQAVWVGLRSPKSEGELRTMSVQEIASFLHEWRPASSRFLEPSPEGLGRTLSKLVEADPHGFAQQAHSFQACEATYVRAVLNGLREAVKGGREFDWTPVLELCRWAVQQPRDPVEQRAHGERDPDWSWTRSQIADLVSEGFKEAGGIPFALRETVWAVLEPISADPNPTPDHEARYGGTNMDPPTLALNTVRGQAMDAVIRYALWVRRALSGQVEAAQAAPSSFDELPEVRSVLDAHLDPVVDPSPAVRSVYGRWFPWLVFLDRYWAEASAARIFSLDAGQRNLRAAAWETYERFCEPFNCVFPVLEPEYRLAVEQLTSRPGGATAHSPECGLVEHLVIFYGRGVHESSVSALLFRFFEVSGPELRAYAIEYVGRSLGEAQDVPSAVIERFKALWQRRLQTARQAEAPEVFSAELAQFGWWFASGKFDRDWAVEQLLAAGEVARDVGPGHLVAPKLLEFVREKPAEVLRVFDTLVDADKDGWEILGWRDELREALSVALAGSSAEARHLARALVHKLGAKGYLEFRDLLNIKPL